MRAVVDTNVLIRAPINPGGSLRLVLTALRDAWYRIAYSEPVLAELVEVMGRPRMRTKYGVTDADAAGIVELFARRGDLVTPVRHITVCRDPKDNMFLEAAVAGNADVIVSGDEDLLVLNPFEGIAIVPPSEFITQLRSR